MEDNNCLVWHFVKSLMKFYNNRDEYNEYAKRSEIRKYLSHKKRVPKQLTNQVINELYQLGFLIRGDIQCKYKIDEEKAQELSQKIKYNKKMIQNA